MTATIDQVARSNDNQWDSYYATYEAGQLVPGVKFPNEHLVRLVHRVIDADPTPPSERKIVELGFGNITNMVMMHDLGFQVSGLEVSQEAVRRGTLALKQRGLADKIHLGTFSNGKLPFEDASLDLIVGLQCVYYNLDQAAFAAECARVLKPGGTIFFSFFSPAAGYMKYIRGQPGSLVTFTDNHPNPRLVGLSLFLYRDRAQFETTFGQEFDISVGIEESDLIPLFSSWYYVFGQKKQTDRSRRVQYPISRPAKPAGRAAGTSKVPAIDAKAATSHNAALWDAWHASLPDTRPYAGPRYPNEYIICFLATRERRRSEGFFSRYQGREDSQARGDGLAALEINPENPANLLMAGTLGYRATGVTWSNAALKRAREIVSRPEFLNAFAIEPWDCLKLPFDDASFDTVFSFKAPYYQVDQRQFVRECARVLRPGGEVFLAYLAPDHSYMECTEQVGDGLYRFLPGHLNPRLVGAVVYVGDPSQLAKLWGDYVDVQIKFVKLDNHPIYSSFNIVTGVRNTVPVRESAGDRNPR